MADAVTPVTSDGTGADLPPPAPSVASAAAVQHAKSVAGTEAKQAAKKYVFDPAEEAAANQRIRDKAQAAGEQAYDAAIAANKNEKQAKNDANKAARQTAQAEAELEAQQAARRALQGGTAFDASKLDADASNQLANFQSGSSAAQRLATALNGQSDGGFQALMAQEVAGGHVPAPRTIQIDGPPQQPMQMWEYPDGTVVRYKPLGDDRRSTPTYSIEVKKDPSLPDSGSDSAAFKVDATGNPIPKKPHEVANPFPKNTNQVQHEAFIEELMEAAHLSLTP